MQGLTLIPQARVARLLGVVSRRCLQGTAKRGSELLPPQRLSLSVPRDLFTEHQGSRAPGPWTGLRELASGFRFLVRRVSSGPASQEPRPLVQGPDQSRFLCQGRGAREVQGRSPPQHRRPPFDMKCVLQCTHPNVQANVPLGKPPRGLPWSCGSGRSEGNGESDPAPQRQPQSLLLCICPALLRFFSVAFFLLWEVSKCKPSQGVETIFLGT